MKLSTIRRLIKEADATAAPAGDFDQFMSSIEQLEKHAKERRVMEPDYSKQDLLSDIHRELPDIDQEMADKMVDFVFKHIDSDVTEASISVDMQEAPTAEELDVGEPVKIVGNVNYHGKCGHIDSFGSDKKFVIVDLGNDGLRSFHSSDVSYYAADDNDEAEDGDIEESVDEAGEDAFINNLKGLQEWNVTIMNNFYSGKYPDYSARHYSVVAGSPEEARQVVLNNADYVLKDLLSRKLQSGKRVLPAQSALPIEDKRVGSAKPGSLTTMGFKKMLTPDGVKSLKFAGGKIVDSEEQGVEEAYQFKGPFPFDVDHMHGGRGINLPSAPTKKFFTDKKQWERAVNDINSSKYDDNSEYTGQTGRSTVSIDGREWARWSDAQQKGYIELSSMSEQGVTEMDSQGYRGSRDSVEDDAGKKEYYGKAVTAKDVTKKASSILNKAFKGNYSDEEHPIRDDGNEGRPGKQRYPKSVAEDAEGEKPTTWYKDNVAYTLQRNGSQFHLIDKTGRVVKNMQIPPRYIPMNLEDQGYTMSRTGREYYKNPGWFKEAAGDNPEDVICVDVPLFIRLMEYAREDAKTDMDLHVVTEKLTAMSAEGRTLSMADYDAIISTDTVEEETVNEVSPHNYDSDIDYYNALNRRKPQRQEPDDDIGSDDDYNDRLRFKPAAAKPTQDLNNEEGTAPNGKKYNNTVTFSGGATAFANKAAADSFADYHWGAKDVVDAKQEGDKYVLYVVDNHKYGMWKPWKEQAKSNESMTESKIAKGQVLNEYAAFKKGVK